MCGGVGGCGCLPRYACGVTIARGASRRELGEVSKGLKGAMKSYSVATIRECNSFFFSFLIWCSMFGLARGFFFRLFF